MTDAKTWAKRVTDWRASGLTASEYCSGRGFSRTALYWWSSKLRKDGPDTSGPRETVPMARVVRRPRSEPAPEIAPEMAVVLIECGDARVFVPSGVDRATLTLVLQVLEDHQGGSR